MKWHTFLLKNINFQSEYWRYLHIFKTWDSFYHCILLLFFLLLYGNKNETEDLFKKYFFQSKIRKKKKNTFHAIGGITSFYNFSCELKKKCTRSINFKLTSYRRPFLHQLSRQSSLKIFPCNKCKSVANRSDCR